MSPAEKKNYWLSGSEADDGFTKDESDRELGLGAAAKSDIVHTQRKSLRQKLSTARHRVIRSRAFIILRTICRIIALLFIVVIVVTEIAILPKLAGMLYMNLKGWWYEGDSPAGLWTVMWVPRGKKVVFE